MLACLLGRGQRAFLVAPVADLARTVLLRYRWSTDHSEAMAREQYARHEQIRGDDAGVLNARGVYLLAMHQPEAGEKGTRRGESGRLREASLDDVCSHGADDHARQDGTGSEDGQA